MGFTTILLIAAIVVTAGLLVRRRRGSRNEPGEGPGAGKQDSRFHAVSIKYEGPACGAARNLAGQRFLASEAPRLPLPDCDAAQCQCRFAHHPDRRTGKDRRSPFAPSGRAGSTGEYLEEQRSGGDRRRNDNA